MRYLSASFILFCFKFVWILEMYCQSRRGEDEDEKWDLKNAIPLLIIIKYNINAYNREFRSNFKLKGCTIVIFREKSRKLI